MTNFAQAHIKELPIAASTVDLLFTDPPYPTKFLQCYEWLAVEAMRVLKPGGFLVAMCGGLNLNKIFRMFDDVGLLYFWECQQRVSSGNAPRVWRHRAGKKFPIIARSKSILVYSKGEAVPTSGNLNSMFDPLPGDFTISKSYHKWGQDVATCRYYIEMFSGAGALVLDPFIGGGTTAVACELLQRRWVGFDLDFTALLNSRSRLQGAQVTYPLPLFTQIEGDH